MSEQVSEQASEQASEQVRGQRAGRPDAAAAPRIAGLDTLRAVAVLLVVAYHLFVPGLAGGYLGVTVFFTISGYLITRLLLVEAQTTGTIDLVGFWRRRLRRLAPVALLVVAVVLVWSELAAPRQLTQARPGGLAASLYGYNWWQIAHHVSYFESWQLPSPLTHYWSLSIEEQFYLLWPVLLVALLALVPRRGILALIALAVAGSSAWTAWLGHTGAVDRAYLGTDTRAAELLVGAFVAVLVHLPRRRQQPATPRALPGAVWVAAVVAAATTLTGCVVVTATHPQAPYDGGLLVTALATVVLVVGVQRAPLCTLAERLDRGLPGWIGRRSYAIYLWHFPLVVACSRARTYRDFSPARAVVVIALSAALAEASYRLLERPVRRHGLAPSVAALGRALRTAAPRMRALVVLTTAAAVVALLGAVLGVRAPATGHDVVSLTVGQAPRATPARHPGHRRGSPHSRPGGTPARTPDDTPASAPSGPSPTAASPSDPSPAGPAAAPTSAPSGASADPSSTGSPAPTSPTTTSPATPATPATPRTSSSPAPDGHETVAVGDSLMIDIASELRDRLPGVTIDAEVGRQPSTGLDVADGYGQFDRTGGTYILGIGTNGGIDASSLVAFCRSHARARVLLITPRVDRSWESTSIDAIRDAAGQCPNVTVVDFHDAAAGHDDWFGSDGVHLTGAGIDAMVDLILSADRTS